jgi:hypothetical protein
MIRRYNYWKKLESYEWLEVVVNGGRWWFDFWVNMKAFPLLKITICRQYSEFILLGIGIGHDQEA